MGDLLGTPKAPDLPTVPPLPPPPEADTSATARTLAAIERKRRGRDSLLIDPAMPGNGANANVLDITQ